MDAIAKVRELEAGRKRCVAAVPQVIARQKPVVAATPPLKEVRLRRVVSIASVVINRNLQSLIKIV